MSPSSNPEVLLYASHQACGNITVLLLFRQRRRIIIAGYGVNSTHVYQGAVLLAAGALAAAAHHTHAPSLIATTYAAAAAAANFSCLGWHLGAWSLILKKSTIIIIFHDTHFIKKLTFLLFR